MHIASILLEGWMTTIAYSLQGRAFPHYYQLLTSWEAANGRLRQEVGEAPS